MYLPYILVFILPSLRRWTPGFFWWPPPDNITGENTLASGHPLTLSFETFDYLPYDFSKSPKNSVTIYSCFPVAQVDAIIFLS